MGRDDHLLELASMGAAAAAGYTVMVLGHRPRRHARPGAAEREHEASQVFRSQLDRAAKMRGITGVPLVVTTTRVTNAGADGRRIYLNPRWASAMLDRYCDSPTCQRSLLLAVAAHELDHWIQKRTGSQPPMPQRELVADYAAGRALAQARVSSTVIERVLGDLAARKRTHPSSRKRIQALRAGYRSIGQPLRDDRLQLP